MRYTHLTFFALSTLIAACGGGSGGSADSTSTLPPSIPTATVSGSAVDGLILQGTVSVYNFASGAKGTLLGTATTDNVGHYSVSIQSESTPVLIEVSGGYYLEEASGTRVSLQSDQKLTALANFKTGTPITMAVTPWTHFAAALAIYNTSKGATLASAIDAANTRISTMLGIDIQTTIPVDVTNIANQAATLTPAIQYGWMSAAISLWTYDALSSLPLQRHNPPYTSINFAQVMYNDVLADGLLNGIGASGQLSFSTTPLGVGVYRHDLGVAMLKFASNSNNKVGMTTSLLLNAARNYANSTDAIWNGVVPISIETPSVAIISPTTSAWVRRTVTVNGAVNDSAGLTINSLLIDGRSIASSTTNLTSPSFSWDSTVVSDGAHTIGLAALNVAGMTGSATISVNVDNTSPTLGIFGISGSATSNPTAYDQGSNWPYGLELVGQCTINGYSGDLGSGLSTLTVKVTDDSALGYQSTVIQPPNTNWSATLPIHTKNLYTGAPPRVSTLTITHSDVAGNTTTVSRVVRSEAASRSYSCDDGSTCDETTAVNFCVPE